MRVAADEEDEEEANAAAHIYSGHPVSSTSHGHKVAGCDKIPI